MQVEVTQNKVNKFLDDLRETGITNMYGAGPYIQEIFGVTKSDANRFLLNWIETFDNRVNHGDVQNVD